MCSDPPLVGDKPLGAPTFVKLVYCGVCNISGIGIHVWERYGCPSRKRIQCLFPFQIIIICIPVKYNFTIKSYWFKFGQYLVRHNSYIHANASSNAIFFWNDGNSNQDNHLIVPEPIAVPAQPGAFPGKFKKQWPRVRHGHNSTKNSPLPPQCVLKDLLRNRILWDCSQHMPRDIQRGSKEKKKSDVFKQPNPKKINWELGCGTMAGEDRDTGVARWHQARNCSPLPNWKP